ncbi:hypothetical protein WOLCODRAFT_166487 [Wolfiporia cocos MD-104 SS10]|uniref:HAD phosphatase n=1 Tax=Wolfiporia cocos (strain MD-104) TaxID=742152 RepID=A0A2H3J0L8_WOLCO|nr:hypothetical protein WOLCODRAFT_166487 [Wolfiporia cocos MD-104 SS10]
MPLNIPGALIPFHLLVNPRLILPSIAQDIRQLDFPALKRAGYRGAVFDKDNCLTIPHRDGLVRELTECWKECHETFGEGNVLVVSNSAGSHLDAGEIQAEAVSHALSVPVLRHASPKPSYACIASIRAYFASLPAPVRDAELIVVGDRLMTDVVLANRMARYRSSSSPHRNAASEQENEGKENGPAGRTGPLAVWTTSIWKREGLVVRAIEQGILRGVERWIAHKGDQPSKELSRFVKMPPKADMHQEKEGILRRWLGKIRLGKA